LSDWVDVGLRADLPPGSWRVIEVDGTQIAVFNVDGTFLAIEDICTHDGGDLAGGEVDGDQVICPRHGARFCLRTGAALTPPAYDAVDIFPIRIENGTVQVRDDRWD